MTTKEERQAKLELLDALMSETMALECPCEDETGNKIFRHVKTKMFMILTGHMNELLNHRFKKLA